MGVVGVGDLQALWGSFPATGSSGSTSVTDRIEIEKFYCLLQIPIC